MKMKVKLRRDRTGGVKPEAEQLDGKEFNFYYGWDLEEDDARYPGETVWVADDPAWPENAPMWIAGGDLVVDPATLFGIDTTEEDEDGNGGTN